MFRTAHQNVRCDPDGLQFLNGVLCWFGFQFTRGRKVWQQCQVHKDGLPAWKVVVELADRFKERQSFDIAHSPADFAQHEVNFVIANVQEFFDFVGDVGHNLDRFTQIIATALFFQNGRIDAARADRVRVARRNTSEAFVVAQIKIGFGPIIRHKYFAVFKRGHRARIDV